MMNYEAEASVLGTVLIDGNLFHDLELEAFHFGDVRHRKIFHAMKKAAANGEMIDVVVVTTHLGEEIYEIGTTEYLVKLAESVPSTATLKHYERLVFDAYRLRKSREYALHYVNRPSEDGLQLLIKNLEKMQDVAQTYEKSTYDYLLDITTEMLEPTEELSCVTGFRRLDNLTGGFQKGDLIIIAARPSVGKTAFALNLAAGHMKQGGACTILSLEMGTKQLLHRMISAESKINSKKWKNNVFSISDYRACIQSIGMLSEWDLAISDSKRTILEIQVAIRKRVRESAEKIHLIIIDYLQLITPTTKESRRDLQIGEITRELKLLAVELDIPIILLSQLSRGVESRNNKRPMMSDLRESGNIEQDADVISFLYREDYYDNDTDKKDLVEVIIAKHRNGPTGKIEFMFMKDYGRFVEV